jgi:crotonobetaine/carnitine-CoA ligase
MERPRVLSGEAAAPRGGDLPPVEELTIGAILRRAARYGASRPAVIFGDRIVSYGELDAQADRVATALRGLGVEEGERVAVLMANRPEYMALYYGVARARAVFVPLVTASKLPELAYFLEHSGAKVLVTDLPRWRVLHDAATQARSRVLGQLKAVVVVADEVPPGTVGFEDVLSAVTPTSIASPEASDLYALMYTSGSTGRPKAVMHSHYTGVAQARAVSQRMQYTPEDRLITVFPLFHGNALVWSGFTAAYAGAAFVLTERFSASQFWDQVRASGATAVNLLLGAINMLLAQPERDNDRDHPLEVTAAAVTQEIRDRFVTRYGVDVVTLWALAEGPLGTMATRGFGYTSGLIGWPMGHDNEIRVVDSDDREVPDGEVGELVQRNDAVMLGYYNDPEETARVMRNGWLHSGDLGRRDANGLFYFVGRAKHTIRRSGENISGEEVEECILAHPAVADCAAIAVPDEIRGEEVKVCVVPLAGVAVTEREIVDWVAERLADFKVPRYLQLRESLPRTGPEKVARHVLLDEPDLLDCWDRSKEIAR